MSRYECISTERIFNYECTVLYTATGGVGGGAVGGSGVPALGAEGERAAAETAGQRTEPQPVHGRAKGDALFTVS